MNVETPQNSSTLEIVVWTVTALAAINLGLVGAMDTNILGNLFEPGTLRLVYIAIGIAGLLDTVDLWTTERILGGSR